MKSCSVSQKRIECFTALCLNNGHAAVEILPELGGKIWNLYHPSTDTHWIWHNPHVRLQALALGASYNDHWAGGWEELFPNDAAGDFMGRDLPDHGEWWSQPWKWEEMEDSQRRVTVRLWHEGVVTQTRCEKWITLEANMASVSIRYRITNLEATLLYFLFKQHLAVAVTPTHRLELPGGKVTPVDLSFSTRIGTAGPFDWPMVQGKTGEPVDLSVLLLPELMHREFIYVAELPEGWCGVRDTRTGARLRLHFPCEVFPYTWLFMTFGGWRGLYTVVLEPCTNMPKDLNAAFRLGQCAMLHTNETLDCEVHVVLS